MSSTPHRPQTPGAEVANSIGHGIGFILAIVAWPLLVRAAAHRSG